MARITRRILISLLFCIVLFCTYMAYSIHLSNSETLHTVDVFQRIDRRLLRITFAVCLILIGFTSYYTLVYSKDLIAYLITQRFKYAQLDTQIPDEVISLGDVFINFLGIGFMAFPVLVFGVTLVVDYEPIKVFLSVLSIELVFKLRVFSSLIYGLLTLYFAIVVMNFLLLLIIVVEGFCKVSSRLLIWEDCPSRNRFSKKVNQFRILQMFLELGNLITRSHIAFFVAFGMIIASICSYTTVVGYQDRVSAVAYLTSPVIALLCMIIAMVVLAFAGVPNSDGKEFIRLWRLHQKPRYNVEKGCVISFPEVGLHVGPFRNLG